MARFGRAMLRVSPFLSKFSFVGGTHLRSDAKTWLDFDRYTPRDLARMLDQPRVVASSWAEKRQDLFDAIATLPAPLRSQATNSAQTIRAVEPELAGMQRHSAAETIQGRHFEIALISSRVRLHGCAIETGCGWASALHPLAHFSHQTLSGEDYERFFAA
jgi:hypothetical protein